VKHLFGNFVMVRRGVIDHLGELSPTQHHILLLLVLLADAATGVWEGNAACFVSMMQGKISNQAVQDALLALEERGYILRGYQKAHKGWFPILIDKYDITMGKNKEERVDLQATKEHYGLGPFSEFNSKRLSECPEERAAVHESLMRAIKDPLFEELEELELDDDDTGAADSTVRNTVQNTAERTAQHTAERAGQRTSQRTGQGTNNSIQSRVQEVKNSNTSIDRFNPAINGLNGKSAEERNGTNRTASLSPASHDPLMNHRPAEEFVNHLNSSLRESVDNNRFKEELRKTTWNPKDWLPIAKRLLTTYSEWPDQLIVAVIDHATNPETEPYWAKILVEAKNPMAMFVSKFDVLADRYNQRTNSVGRKAPEPREV
jgi:hypothetical protein